LKDIPLFLPKCFEIEEEDDFFHWVFKGFQSFIDFESILNELMDIEILHDEIELINSILT